MIITNVGADYSGTGLGKVPYVSQEVSELLSIYSGITLPQKQAFQSFIDDIGGLSGAIFSKVYNLFIPQFASNLLEAMRDVKGMSNPFFNLNDTGKSIGYSFSNGSLSQNNVVASGYSNQLTTNGAAYLHSGFGIVKRSVSEGYGNYITLVALGNLMKSATTNDFTIQKADGTVNQYKTVSGLATRTKHAYSFSGLTGIDADNQNNIVIDGVEGLQVIQPSFNLTLQARMSIGYAMTSTTPTNKLTSAYLLGYAFGLTRQEAKTINAALLSFIDSLD